MSESKVAGGSAAENNAALVDMPSADGRAFRMIADNAPALMRRARPDKQCDWFNKRWLDFTGRTIGEESGLGWSEGVHPEDRDRCIRIYDTAFDARKPFALEFRLRRHDGEYRWIHDNGVPFVLEDGDFGGYLGSATDITEHVEREARLREAHDRQQSLVDELNHRVKNTLAMVQSIAVQTFRKLAEGDGPLRQFEGRLAILGASQDLLARNQWRGASLRETVQIAVRPFAGLDQPSITVSGPDVMLTARQASALSFAFHELCVNALKFGALSVHQGRLSIEWSVEESGSGRRLLLVWREEGGPTVTPPTHRGFGLRMVERGLAHEFSGKAEIKFRPEGLECTISSELGAQIGAPGGGTLETRA